MKLKNTGATSSQRARNGEGQGLNFIVNVFGRVINLKDYQNIRQQSV